MERMFSGFSLGKLGLSIDLSFRRSSSGTAIPTAL